MPPKTFDRRLAILDGGWGVHMGPDMMYRQFEEGHDKGPDTPALICTHQRSGPLIDAIGTITAAEGWLTWTYRHLAAVLTLYGVKRGDTMIVFLPNGAEWTLSFWIAIMLDLTFVPLDPGSLVPRGPEEADYPLKQLKPTIVLVPNPMYANLFDKFYPGVSEKLQVSIVCHAMADDSMNGWITFDSLTQIVGYQSDAKRPERDATVADDRVAAVLFNVDYSEHSPKGCPLRVLNIRTAVMAQYMPPKQRMLISCPPSSSMTLEAAILAWSWGGTVVIAGPTFSADWAFNAIERHGCTHIICMPLHLAGLIKHPSLPERQITSLQGVSVNGGFVNEWLLAAAKQELGIEWASPALTMSEGFGTLGWTSVAYGDRTLDSVGTVMWGSVVKICGRNGHVVGRGEQGRLHIGGDAIIEGYLGGVANEYFYRDMDGTRWFITNYYGEMDMKGLVRLESRGASLPPSK
jgi:acyl-CoA synthetase (AMP-forming)/AMP-acid ligase II